MTKASAFVWIAGLVAGAAISACGDTDAESDLGRGGKSGSGGAAGQAGATGSIGGSSTGGWSAMGGVAGMTTSHDPCETPSLPWPTSFSGSGCPLSGWGRGWCKDFNSSDPAWACIEGTTGCKDNGTCFIGVAIIGECPPNSSVTFSCEGLDAQPAVITKTLPVYSVCKETNPCTEITSGFVCAKVAPNVSDVINGAITINGETCKFE